jgi:hypothetical protein
MMLAAALFFITAVAADDVRFWGRARAAISRCTAVSAEAYLLSGPLLSPYLLRRLFTSLSHSIADVLS